MSLKLACFFPLGEHLFFSAKADPGDYIDGLRKVVWLELRDLGQDVALMDLSLYKTDIPFLDEEENVNRALQFLHEHSERTRLKINHTVDRVFPQGPSGDDRLDIIVATPEVLESLKTFGEPEATYRVRIRKAKSLVDLDEKVKKLPSRFSPSDTVKEASHIKALFGAEQIYRNQVPVALFSPALAKLQQRLEENDAKLDSHDVTRAHEYIGKAINFYTAEEDRENAIRTAIEGVLSAKDNEPTSLESQWGERLAWADGIKPSKCWFANGFLSEVLELKNVPGVSGDPILHCIVDLSKIIPSSRYNGVRGACNFPVVLIGIAGSRLQISIAAYVGAIFVSDLVTVDLSRGFHGSVTTTRLARIFQALSLCHQELKEYYAGIQPSPRSDSSWLYPHPITANGVPLPLVKYDKYLGLDGLSTETVPDLGERSTAVYTGTLEKGERVLIKFTHRYNKVAHTLLADAGLAPQLHFVNPIVGNLLMIVMDYIPEAKPVWKLLDEGASLPPIILDKVESAVSLLHDRNIVFGDLRDGNILYYRDDVGEDRVILVDFDWAGVDNVDRYSATLNVHGGWAGDVCPYGVMKKKHDLWQIARLRTLITAS
ncbi:hypothetical protein MD484_g7677, partial [Candolleomyces efflorescens]